MGPLQGTRVVELAGIGPLPHAAMLLAELGADVIRIDRPGWQPLGIPARHDLSLRGRPSLGVDLKDPRGVDLVRRLAGGADVFLEGFRPGVAERLGLGPDDLRGAHRELIYGRMTGWGQSGPLAEHAGHDIDFIAVTGMLHAIGSTAEPAVPLNLVGDLGGGAMYLVVGVLAALLERVRSGEGQVIDAAIVDGTTHLGTAVFGLLAAGLWEDRRATNLIDGGTPYYAVYETRDGRHLAVGPLEDRFYDDFAARIELAADAPDRSDRSRWPHLRQAIGDRIRTRDLADWIEAFDGSDSCVAPVLALSEAVAHPHLAARGTLVDVDGVVQPAPAPRFSRTPGTLAPASAEVSADPAHVLTQWGIDDAATLVEAGVVAAPPAEER
ncbi:MAG TPA: CaiB/BaiF CoA-transferase family protein [Nocardioidaceae bacterium]|nr:CaiB/BaiF CoA-transferase family protein [Nocardioidaceae bacterium]